MGIFLKLLRLLWLHYKEVLIQDTIIPNDMEYLTPHETTITPSKVHGKPQKRCHGHVHVSDPLEPEFHVVVSCLLWAQHPSTMVFDSEIKLANQSKLPSGERVRLDWTLTGLGTESISFLSSLKTCSCQFWVTRQACYGQMAFIGLLYTRLWLQDIFLGNLRPSQTTLHSHL